VYAKCITSVVVALASVAAVAADESRIVLKEAPDAALTLARCSVCHSVDYIQMDSPFLNKAGWTAEVNKMIKVMGAPITEDEASKIVAYLTHYYGVE